MDSHSNKVKIRGMPYPGILNKYSKTHCVEGPVMKFSQIKDLW